MYRLELTTNEEVEVKLEDSVFSIEDIQSDIYEITVDGEFAGFIAYTVEMIPELGWTLYVEAVELMNEFQGQGIYRQMLLDLAEQEDVDAVAGENEGEKGIEYKGLSVNGYKVSSMWVRFVS